MSLPGGQPSLDARLRTMRIITIAIINGAVIFLAIAVFLQARGNMGLPRNPPIISYFALVVAGIDVLIYWFAPDAMAARARRQIARGTWMPDPRRPEAAANMTDDQKLLAVYQTRLIVGLALLEGATFLLLIGYLTEDYTPALAIAVVFIIGMLMQFPTRIGVERWVEEQQQLLQEERQRSG